MAASPTCKREERGRARACVRLGRRILIQWSRPMDAGDGERLARVGRLEPKRRRDGLIRSEFGPKGILDFKLICDFK